MLDFFHRLAGDRGPWRVTAGQASAQTAADLQRPLLAAARAGDEAVTAPAGQRMDPCGVAGHDLLTLTCLPGPAMLGILQHLSAGDARRLASTCKALHQQVEHKGLWLQKFAQTTARPGYAARSQMQPATLDEIRRALVWPFADCDEVIGRSMGGCCLGCLVGVFCLPHLPCNLGGALVALECGMGLCGCSGALCWAICRTSANQADVQRTAFVRRSVAAYEKAFDKATQSATILSTGAALNTYETMTHINRIRAFCDLSHADGETAVLMEAFRRRHVPALKEVIGPQFTADLTDLVPPAELSAVVNALIDAGEFATAGHAVRCGASLSQPDGRGVTPDQRLTATLEQALRTERWETVEPVCSANIGRVLSMPLLAELPTPAAAPPDSAPHARARVKAVLHDAIAGGAQGVFPRFAALVADDIDLCRVRDALLRTTIVEGRLGDAHVLMECGARVGRGDEGVAVRRIISARMDEADRAGDVLARRRLARLGR